MKLFIFIGILQIAQVSYFVQFLQLYFFNVTGQMGAGSNAAIAAAASQAIAATQQVVSLSVHLTLSLYISPLTGCIGFNFANMPKVVRRKTRYI